MIRSQEGRGQQSGRAPFRFVAWRSGFHGEGLSVFAADVVIALFCGLCPVGQEVSEGYRSEERRVRKECRSRWSPYHEKKTANMHAGEATRITRYQSAHNSRKPLGHV